MEHLVHLAFFLGSTVCHQLPEHSLFIGGRQLPLCARCTGMHFGMWMGFYYLLVLRKHKLGLAPNWKVLVSVAGLMLIMAFDVFSVLFGWRPGLNQTRLATGLGTGFALSLLMAPVIAEVKRAELSRSKLNWKDILLGLVLTLALWPLIFFAPGVMFYPITFFEGASVIGIYTLIWGSLVAFVVVSARNRPAPWWLWLGIGFVASVIQSIAVGMFRIKVGF